MTAKINNNMKLTLFFFHGRVLPYLHRRFFTYLSFSFVNSCNEVATYLRILTLAPDYTNVKGGVSRGTDLRTFRYN